MALPNLPKLPGMGSGSGSGSGSTPGIPSAGEGLTNPLEREKVRRPGVGHMKPHVPKVKVKAKVGKVGKIGKKMPSWS